MTYSTKKNTWCYRQGFYQIPKKSKNTKIKNTKAVRISCDKQEKMTDKHAPKELNDQIDTDSGK